MNIKEKRRMAKLCIEEKSNSDRTHLQLIRSNHLHFIEDIHNLRHCFSIRLEGPIQTCCCESRSELEQSIPDGSPIGMDSFYN